MRDRKQRRPDLTIGPHDLEVPRLLWNIVEIDFILFITKYSGSLDFVLRGKLAGFLRCSLPSTAHMNIKASKMLFNVFPYLFV